MSSTTLRRVLLAPSVLVALAVLAPTNADAGSWPSGVTTLSVTAGHTATTTGNLSSGKAIDLAWASESSVACFPATERTNFGGHHVFYAVSLPKNSELKITATPDDAKTDISLYAYTLGATRFDAPPKVSSVVSCEAGYDQVKDSNPGQAETVKLVATTNPYNVLIGVAGVKGTAAGGFGLKLELTSKETVSSATLTATPITVGQEVASNLDKGGVIDLAWAANSSMACFPATENVNFNGNHVLFTVDLPKQTEMTITATPDGKTTDLSVYAYTVSATGTPTLPPTVSSAVSCEAGYDQKNDSNPGVAETAKLIATTNPYKVVIGVAGAGATKSGAFKLKVTTKAR
jgi:hypothetical protein